MIVIKLQGGLGNQMFQYAFAKILGKKNKTNIVIEANAYNIEEKRKGYTPRNFELAIFENEYSFARESDIRLFNNLSFIDKIKRKFKLNYPKNFTENKFEYSQQAHLLKSPAFVTGYFQSFKYFEGFENDIRNLYVFNHNELSQENINLIPILKKGNTIAIHIRRGDYVSDEVTNQFHGCCSYDYYMEAISKITLGLENPTLVFFSDDPKWVKENFDNLPFDKIFINHNQGKNSWVDMFLMSICTHNIIANSSFSWWGAWLNSNPKKIVIAPKIWFSAKEIDINSLIPAEWILI